jgi:hypothetical protein
MPAVCDPTVDKERNARTLIKLWVVMQNGVNHGFTFDMKRQERHAYSHPMDTSIKASRVPSDLPRSDKSSITQLKGHSLSF